MKIQFKERPPDFIKYIASAAEEQGLKCVFYPPHTLTIDTEINPDDNAKYRIELSCEGTEILYWIIKEHLYSMEMIKCGEIDLNQSESLNYLLQLITTMRLVSSELNWDGSIT